MNRVEKLEFIDRVLETYMLSSTISNNYMLRDEYLHHIAMGNLFIDIDDHNAFIYLRRNGFYRVYYLINQEDRTFSFNAFQPLVLEILYRGEKNFPQNAKSFWELSGFQSHLSRDAYFLKNTAANEILDLRASQVIKAHSHEHISFTKRLIDEYLDLYTGDNLSLEQIESFVSKGLVYLALDDGQMAGILQADHKSGIFWLGHLVVDPTFRGKGVAQKLLKYYLNEGAIAKCNQFQLWVIKDNEAAVGLYKKHGFNYLNKSTFSMLKM